MPPRGKRRLEDDQYDGPTYSYYPSAGYPYMSQAPSTSSRVTASSSKLLNALDGRPSTSFKSSVSVAADFEKPKPKRARKDCNAPVQEKRDARFKKACPKNILDRVERVISQRFFMVDRRREGQELMEEFSVLGSTGNVYTVTIDKIPSCNCPDAIKGNHCKHILFIFLKVLQVPQHSTHWFQKALLTSELEEIFRDAPPAPNAVAKAQVCDAYAHASGRASSSSKVSISNDDASKKRRIPGVEDDCPICYEGMHNVSTTMLTWCEECGNALHKECFQRWAKTKTNNLTCVFCRAKWVVASNNKGRGLARVTSEGYINLSQVAGVSPKRDTSSYYHGPRKGQRHYGYQSYETDD